MSRPQGRAQETARIALNGHGYAVDERIAEINTLANGKGGCARNWSMRNTEHRGTYASNWRPGGEGIDALETRVREFLERFHRAERSL